MTSGAREISLRTRPARARMGGDDAQKEGVLPYSTVLTAETGGSGSGRLGDPYERIAGGSAASRIAGRAATILLQRSVGAVVVGVMQQDDVAAVLPRATSPRAIASGVVSPAEPILAPARPQERAAGPVRA